MAILKQQITTSFGNQIPQSISLSSVIKARLQVLPDLVALECHSLWLLKTKQKLPILETVMT